LKPFMRAWLKLAWHFPRVRDVDLWEQRERLVRSLAPGKSFIDVGGMWDVSGRVAFMAEEAGAERVVLLDAMLPTDEFDAKRTRRGSEVRYVTGDLHDRDGIEELGRFDVVWCTGVLYHSPNPMLQLMNLRLLASECLVLGTHVIPEVPGLEQACLFYPKHSDAARDEWTHVFGRSTPVIGVTSPFDPAQAYANWWWGMSPSAVRAMLDVAGFAVTEERPCGPLLTDFVASPV
jgi:SAM-dependent methyltransferase